MMRFTALLLLVFVAGCATPTVKPDPYDDQRLRDAEELMSVLLDYLGKKGQPPLLGMSRESGLPVKVVIGHGPEHEAWARQQEVLKPEGQFVTSARFVSLLEEGIGKPVTLPRDPAPAASFAPNVYLYHVADMGDYEEFCVIVNVSRKSPNAVPGIWKRKRFYAHTHCLSRKVQ